MKRIVLTSLFLILMFLGILSLIQEEYFSFESREVLLVPPTNVIEEEQVETASPSTSSPTSTSPTTTTSSPSTNFPTTNSPFTSSPTTTSPTINTLRPTISQEISVQSFPTVLLNQVLDSSCSDIELITYLRKKSLARIEGLQLQHEDGKKYLRGISWIYKNLNGVILAAPELERIFLNKEPTFNSGHLEIEIKDISEKQQCDVTKANKISIWIRLAGPEIVSKLATPVIGKCSWIAKFDISIEGKYTIYSRLLHYKGDEDPGDVTCLPVVVDNKKLNQTSYYSLLKRIPLFPYASPPHVCCQVCRRFPPCEYSVKFNSKEFGGECLLLTKKEGEKGKTISELKKELNIPLLVESEIKYTKMLNTDPVWQLGCGRDEILMRWDPCGSFGSGLTNDAIIRGTEDIILFEHDHRDLLISPSQKITLEDAQLEMEGLGNNNKPICNWDSKKIPGFDEGSWVRFPTTRLQSCPKLNPFQILSGYIVCPEYPINDDPVCFLRFHLQYLTLKEIRWNTNSIYQVWRSELSDSYFRVKGNSDDNKPFVNGPLTAYWKLPPKSPCRLPPIRNVKQIRQCMLDKNISSISLNGKSVLTITSYYLLRVLRAAFPSKNEFIWNNPFSFSFPINQNKTKTKTIYFTNFATPHVITTSFNGRNFQDFNKLKYDLKIWFTPPFMAWERRQYITSERTLLLREKIRNELSNDWYEIDLTSLTMPILMDASTDMDTMHYVGQPKVTVAQLFFDIVCTRDF